MKTIKFLSMAALALVGAMMTGCSNDDNIIDEPQQPAKNVVTMTTTVSLDGGAQTRALTAGGVKTFAAGDQIAVIYKNTSDQTVRTISTALTDGDITNEGKNATFTVTLTDPKAGEAVRYIYPAAMLSTSVETTSDVNADANVRYDALNAQDGTLTTLASTLDLAIFDGSLTSGAALPASATMTNRLAILAVTLKDNAATPADITSTITGMTVNDGTNTYTITRSAAAGPIYVAIRPTDAAAIEITATDGTKHYAKSLTGKTYAASNGYSVSWRMAESLLNITSPSVGQVIGSDGKNYAYGSLPMDVTAVAKICYVSGTHGLALALTDEGWMNENEAETTCAAHTPAFTGGTWKLASRVEWYNMISAAGDYTALRDGFSSVGGTNMQSAGYWSSTVGNVWYWRDYFNFASGKWDYNDKDLGNYVVRACLAFVTAPAETTVTWTASDMEYLILDLGVTQCNSIKGITVTGSGLDMNSWKGTNIEVMDGNATFTFTSSVGNIKSIVITAENINMSEVPSGWTLDDMSSPNTLTWSGTPSATVSLHFEEWQQSIENISTIEFTVVQ